MSKHIRTFRGLAALSRPALAPLPVARPTFPSQSSPVLSGIRSYATHTPPSNPPPTGTPGSIDAQLRSAVESELRVLAQNISSNPTGGVYRYLRPLSPEEVEFVNMGQVPILEGGEVMALLDLNLFPPPFERERGAGPEGTGVHVPLLSIVGSTDPTIPCYPFRELFTQLAPRVVAAVHGVLAAQKGEASDADYASPLVAVLAPHDGEKRDLSIQLAVNLFRLAMQEGNGYQEEIDGSK